METGTRAVFGGVNREGSRLPLLAGVLSEVKHLPIADVKSKLWKGHSQLYDQRCILELLV